MNEPSNRYLAMFSVAGEPFECLGVYEEREEAHQRCEEEATRWRCRTDSFIRVEQEQDA